MKKYLLYISVILLMGSALSMQTEFREIDRDASIDAPAIFQVEVHNNGSEQHRYRLNHDFPKSGWLSYDSYKSIQPRESEVFNITVSPSEEALQNSYNLEIFLEDQKTGVSKSFSSVVNVRRENLLNVKGVDYSSDEVEPGQKVETSITVQNLNSKILDDYSVGSSFEGLSKTLKGEPMAPKALKTYDFEFKVDKNSSPGDRTLETWLNYNQNFQNFTRDIRIKEFRNISRETSEMDRGLYISGRILIVNNGNSNVNVSAEKSLPSYTEPLVSLSHEPFSSVSNQSSTKYIWQTQLSPGEEIEYSYSIDYVTPLVIAVFMIAGLIGLRKFTGNVKVRKTVDRDGGEMMVSIKIINNSTTSKDVIDVEDFVPNVVELHEDFEMTKPEIKEKSDGKVLSWSLEDFNPREKRVITYRVKEKLEVEDGVELPPAKIVEGDKVVSESK